MPLQITLPCKPVVYQYFRNNFGEGSPLALPSHNWLRILIDNMLQRDSAHEDSRITLQYYTHEVKVSIKMYQYERYGDNLSKTAARSINTAVENLIHEDLRLFLPHMVHVRGYKLKDAITLWQTLRAFPEEIYSSDAIKKHYQRNIKPYLKVEKFIGVSVPVKTRRQSNLL